MSSASDIARFIREHDSFLITGHVFPDGDNVGCICALSEALGIMGKKYTSYLEGNLPQIFAWMPCADSIHSEICEAVAKLNGLVESPAFLVVDCSDLSRVGDEFMKWHAHAGNPEIVNIDHHASNSGFGNLNWVDPSYSSVGEMIFEVVKELGIQLTPTLAQSIFVSIYTDTGRFSFSNTSSRAMRYAAECVEAGAVPALAFRNVYASRSIESFQLEAESLHTLTEFLDGKGCYFWVDQDMLYQTRTSLEDTDGFIDTVRTLRDFVIVVFFKEVSANDIRVSARVRPPINAGALMTMFGGGGHPRAAGCRIMKPLDEAIRLFVSTAEDAINSGKVLEQGTQFK